MDCKDGKAFDAAEEKEARVKVWPRARKKAGGAALNADEAMRELSDIAAGRREYPEFTSKGEEYMCLPSISERLKALELIGKHLNLFSDGPQETGEFKVDIKIVE